MDAFFGFYPAAIYEMEDARVNQTFTPLAHFALFTYQDEHGNWRGEKYIVTIAEREGNEIGFIAEVKREK